MAKRKKSFRLSNEQNLYKDVIEIDDQVIPSSNSVMANNLFDIYKVTYDKYFNICNKMLSTVAINAKSSPSNFTNWMLLSKKLNIPKNNILVGFSVKELLEFYPEKNF